MKSKPLKMRLLKTVDLSQLCDLKSAFFLWGLYDIIDDGNPPLSIRLVIDKLKVDEMNVNVVC